MCVYLCPAGRSSAPNVLSAFPMRRPPPGPQLALGAQHSDASFAWAPLCSGSWFPTEKTTHLGSPHSPQGGLDHDMARAPHAQPAKGALGTVPLDSDWPDCTAKACGPLRRACVHGPGSTVCGIWGTTHMMLKSSPCHLSAEPTSHLSAESTGHLSLESMDHLSAERIGHLSVLRTGHLSVAQPGHFSASAGETNRPSVSRRSWASPAVFTATHNSATIPSHDLAHPSEPRPASRVSKLPRFRAVQPSVK